MKATKNFFVVNNFSCNLKCKFCLLRQNKIEQMPDDQNLLRLEKLVKHALKTHDLEIKITGGEPLLRKSLLLKQVEMLNSFDGINLIGIGTNGTIDIPDEFAQSKTKINIFISEHTYIRGKRLEYFNRNNTKCINNVSLNYSCIIKKDGIASISDIKRFLDGMPAKMVCMRGLNNLTISNTSMYPDFVYEYIRYYRENNINIPDLIESIKKDNDFRFIYDKISPYVSSYCVRYKDKEILFKVVDEAMLVDFNKKEDGVDEYVMHPDGKFTGCWDYDLKEISIS